MLESNGICSASKTDTHGVENARHSGIKNVTTTNVLSQLKNSASIKPSSLNSNSVESRKEAAKITSYDFRDLPRDVGDSFRMRDMVVIPELKNKIISQNSLLKQLQSALLSVKHMLEDSQNTNKLLAEKLSLSEEKLSELQVEKISLEKGLQELEGKNKTTMLSFDTTLRNAILKTEECKQLQIKTKNLQNYLYKTEDLIKIANSKINKLEEERDNIANEIGKLCVVIAEMNGQYAGNNSPIDNKLHSLTSDLKQLKSMAENQRVEIDKRLKEINEWKSKYNIIKLNILNLRCTLADTSLVLEKSCQQQESSLANLKTEIDRMIGADCNAYKTASSSIDRYKAFRDKVPTFVKKTAHFVASLPIPCVSKIVNGTIEELRSSVSSNRDIMNTLNPNVISYENCMRELEKLKSIGKSLRNLSYDLNSDPHLVEYVNDAAKSVVNTFWNVPPNSSERMENLVAIATQSARGIHMIVDGMIEKTREELLKAEKLDGRLALALPNVPSWARNSICEKFSEFVKTAKMSGKAELHNALVLLNNDIRKAQAFTYMLATKQWPHYLESECTERDVIMGMEIMIPGTVDSDTMNQHFNKIRNKCREAYEASGKPDEPTNDCLDTLARELASACGEEFRKILRSRKPNESDTGDGGLFSGPDADILKELINFTVTVERQKGTNFLAKWLP
ncbi:MAG: hypothetical protein LBB18_02595 [Puniceicoccales bacterium]|jgi:hypothetical protein|nr:hypothetical protein [Puniceicoccales bacterium]